MAKKKLELISFKLCPFVQRSVILLKEKNISFNISYIDLANKPDWFLKISPAGKVPVLRVGDTILFESAIINEFLDETNPPSLHPPEPLLKAQNRAWIEYSSSLFMAHIGFYRAKDQNEFEAVITELREKLEKVEAQLKGPYFNGEEFSLVDIAFAPLFTRLDLFAELYPLNLFEGLPKLELWSKNLVNRESVKESVVRDFKELFIEYLNMSDSFIATRVPALK